MARQAFIADCDGAAQVSNPRPTNVPGCGGVAATATPEAGTIRNAAAITAIPASLATVDRRRILPAASMLMKFSTTHRWMTVYMRAA
ncbi:hypothetical protein Afe04nite_51850 [Asanoa ferruginea]|nr:hypothetical protein Afe04nite_51850 [Asanoa ferruginea]